MSMMYNAAWKFQQDKMEWNEEGVDYKQIFIRFWEVLPFKATNVYCFLATSSMKVTESRANIREKDLEMTLFWSSRHQETFSEEESNALHVLRFYVVLLTRWSKRYRTQVLLTKHGRKSNIDNQTFWKTEKMNENQLRLMEGKQDS